MKPKVIARPPKPTKPARLTFAQVQAIPVPADCPFELLGVDTEKGKHSTLRL